MPHANPITGISACLFDAYGTLFDVHSAVGRHRPRLGPQADAISALWRNRQLEYTWLRSLMGRHADFWQVTGEALDFALAAHCIDDVRLRADLMAAYLELDCYPEVPAALEQLKTRGLQTAILSNGTPKMLLAAVAHSDLENRIDAVLSIETVRVYKPDPRVYQLAVESLQLPAEAIVFLSANAWDAAGAAAFGLRVAWVNRFQQQPERLPGRPDAEIFSLAELPGLIAA
jgi:2-haloacid dehalogenase